MHVSEMFRGTRRQFADGLPPTPAAAQALLELGLPVPEKGPLPVDLGAAASLGAKWAARVARHASDVEFLTGMAAGEKRKAVLFALLHNRALPEGLVPSVAARAASAKQASLWREAYRCMPRERLTALFEAADYRPRYVQELALQELVLSGYEPAARVLTRVGAAPLGIAYSDSDVSPDSTVLRRLHADGSHEWAADALGWFAARSEEVIAEEDVVAGLESAIISGRRIRVPEGFDLPEYMVDRLLDSHHTVVARSNRDLPEEWVVSNAGKLLDTGWPTRGRWADMSAWSPEVASAFVAALRDVPTHVARSRVAGFRWVLEKGGGAELPGADTVPVDVWTALTHGARSLLPHAPEALPLIWWLRQSAGRPRTADEALAFLTTWEGTRESLGAALLAFVGNAPEEWSRDDKDRVAAFFDRFGDYSHAATWAPDRLGAGGILGDNVAAWKLFYSLAEDWEGGPIALARTAVELAAGE